MNSYCEGCGLKTVRRCGDGSGIICEARKKQKRENKEGDEVENVIWSYEDRRKELEEKYHNPEFPEYQFKEYCRDIEILMPELKQKLCKIYYGEAINELIKIKALVENAHGNRPIKYSCGIDMSIETLKGEK